MCRMCIVDIDTGRGPALQPSCMIPVAEGMKVDADSPGVVKAQDGVLEFLLINHPLDCPVCDKGGECPLQDQAYAYGPGESRFVEEKRHFEKPIPISKLVLLDRERCILCDRCTRFAKDVAGDPLIHFIDRGNETQVNTFPDHPFASYFSGNTVQICPVGALTGRPYRFRARPWDLEKVESTCTVCSFGCRIVIEASRNRVLRYQGVDIDPVNWSWLCDKGRFSFEAINHADRLGQPLVREGDELVGRVVVRRHRRRHRGLRKAIASREPPALGVIGGARLTNEAAYAWAKFAKGVLGTDNVDCQLGDGLPADVVLGLPRATIDEVCDPAGTTVLLERRRPGGTAGPLPATARRRRAPGDALGRDQPGRERRHAFGSRVGALRAGRRHQRHAGGDRQPPRRARALRHRPAVAGRERRLGRGRRRSPARGPPRRDVPAGPAARQRVRGDRHGAGAGRTARAGVARRRPVVVRRRMGHHAGRARTRRRRHPHRRRRGSHRDARTGGRRPDRRLPRP